MLRKQIISGLAVDMVKEVNSTEVSESEILSENIYRYIFEDYIIEKAECEYVCHSDEDANNEKGIFAKIYQEYYKKDEY